MLHIRRRSRTFRREAAWCGAAGLLLLVVAALGAALIFHLRGLPRAADPGRILIEVLEPEERNWPVPAVPVAVGVVFPEAALAAPVVGRLENDLGEEVPFESEVTAWWNAEKTSVQWLLLRFAADSNRQYFFVPGKPAEEELPERLLASAEGEEIIVDTGLLQARLVSGAPEVFHSVRLNGREILSPGSSGWELWDDEGRPLVCESGWNVSIDSNSPRRAVVIAGGTMALPGEADNPLARLTIRYEFHRGESFVRVTHSMLWLQKSLDPGAGRIGLRLAPALEFPATARIGLSNFSDEAWAGSCARDSVIRAVQETHDRFVIRRDGGDVGNGTHLAGWVALEAADGRGAGIALQNAWQTHPTSLGITNGAVDVAFWPEEAGRFSFEERDIMPDDFYYDRQWTFGPATKDGGPTLFNTRDLDPEHSVRLFDALRENAIRSADSPARRILARIPDPLRQRILDRPAGTPVSDALRARLAHAMNSFLPDPGFYAGTAWAGIELQAKTHDLLAKAGLSGPEQIWLNRLLIEAAFPQQISRSDIPHFIHEFSPFGAVPRPDEFLHTGEGSNLSHELTILFFDDASQRSVWEINSLAQHPLVLRQDPRSATRVPFFGIDLTPRDPARFPELERAIQLYGGGIIHRDPELHETGFLRFGLQRSHAPRQGLYRWIAGMQYDQQIIPWMLFYRGGDREFFEEAMNISRYGMDVHTNHFNTRGAPPGYMSFLAGLPLPWSALHRAFNMRAHFLLARYYLTGCPRAWETFQLAVAGRKEAHRRSPRWGRARELYSDNRFLSESYRASFDPELLVMLEEARRETLENNYTGETKAFLEPTAYLLDGLIPMLEILDDAELRKIVLDALPADGPPSPYFAWAFEQTGDHVYARALLDHARVLADLTPDHDWGLPRAVDFPMLGSQSYAHRVLPLLAAMRAADRAGLVENTARDEPGDLLVASDPVFGPASSLVTASRDGDLEIRLLLAPGGADQPAISVARAEAPEQELPGLLIETAPDNTSARIRIPEVRADETLRVTVQNSQPQARVRTTAEASRILHEIRPAQVKIGGSSWQYYRGTRVVLRTNADELTIVSGSPAYTLRDAATGEVLGRGEMTGKFPHRHAVGAGRLVELTLAAGRDFTWQFAGIEPFLAETVAAWQPRQAPNP